MHILTSKIEITSGKTWVFDRVVSVEVERSIENLTTTCKIVLPPKIRWKDEQGIPLKRGDAVKVWLGYDGNNTLVFCGYIVKIGLKVPIEVECEDEMWKLKTKPTVKKAYKSATIRQILDDQRLSCQIAVAGEQRLGEYRVNDNSVAELLNTWKEQGIRSFFKHDPQGRQTLRCGVLFAPETERLYVFDNRQNIIDTDQLKVQQTENTKIKVVAVSMDAKNKKTKVEVGDPDGETRTLHAYGKTKQELKAWAEQELEKVKFQHGGLTGTFTTFGFQLTDRLDRVALKIDGERRGIYRVKKVNITYGSGGFRQEITIEGRIAE